jgi:hypothetical protein
VTFFVIFKISIQQEDECMEMLPLTARAYLGPFLLLRAAALHY